MRNAHQRFGILEFTKRMKDTTTHIQLRLDRFIGELEGERKSRAHLISVVGGDADVGAIAAAINEQSCFTVQGPGLTPVTVTLGEGTQCFRGTINVAGRKPIRHLVAISAELAQTRPGADPKGKRTVLCDDAPVFVLYRVGQRFGLPVIQEWAGWFKEELSRRTAISPLPGLGCSPVLISGTKKQFLKWIGSALRQKRIRFPGNNGPVHWRLVQNFFRLADAELEEQHLAEERE